MSLVDFHRCTPEEFRAIYDFWSKNERESHRAMWETTRVLCLCVLQPHSRKRLNARDIMEFPWDNFEETTQRRCEENDPREVSLRYAEAKKRYGLR